VDALKLTSYDDIVPKHTYSTFYNAKLNCLMKKKFDIKLPDTLTITESNDYVCAKHIAFNAFVWVANHYSIRQIHPFEESDHDYIRLHENKLW
jgi:hypothetical protein